MSLRPLARPRLSTALCPTTIMATCALPALAAPRTMLETLELARSHPQLAAREAVVQARTAGLRAAEGTRLPTAVATAQAGVQRYDDAYADDIPGVGNGTGTAGVGTARFDLSQPLFDGKGRRSQIRIEQARVQEATDNLAWQQRQQAYAAAVAHIRLWLAGQLQEANGRSLEALRGIETTTRKRRSLGDATVTEVAEASARVASAEAAQTALTTEVATRKAAYIAAVGTGVDDVAAPILPTLALSGLGTATGTSATVTAAPITDQMVAEQVAAAVAQHPLVKAAQAEVRAAEAETRRRQAQYYPTVDMGGHVQHDAFSGYERDQPATSGAVTVNMRYALYQGGSVQAGVAEAKAQAMSADATRRDVVLAVTAETEAALRRWQGAAQAERQQYRAVTQAREVLSGMGQELRQGSRTLRDLLDARRDEIGALGQWLNASADQAIAAYDMLRCAGGDAALPSGKLAADAGDATRLVPATQAGEGPVRLAALETPQVAAQPVTPAANGTGVTATAE